MIRLCLFFKRGFGEQGCEGKKPEGFAWSVGLRGKQIFIEAFQTNLTLHFDECLLLEKKPTRNGRLKLLMLMSFSLLFE